jgi:hypothetical protein
MSPTPYSQEPGSNAQARVSVLTFLVPRHAVVKDAVAPDPADVMTDTMELTVATSVKKVVKNVMKTAVKDASLDSI